MIIPILDHKENEEGVLSPEQNINVKKIIEKSIDVKIAIITMDENLDEIMQSMNASVIGGYRCGIDYHAYYLKKSTVFVNSFVGGPAIAGMVEELACLGISKLLFIGGACALANENLDEYLLVTEAIRDEGTSYHYLAPTQTINTNERFTYEIEKILNNRGSKFRHGVIWTTDAYYREGASIIERRINAGAKMVEMESATIAAVSKSKGIEYAQILYCTDYYCEGVWNKNPNRTRKRKDAMKLALSISEEIGC